MTFGSSHCKNSHSVVGSATLIPNLCHAWGRAESLAPHESPSAVSTNWRASHLSFCLPPSLRKLPWCSTSPPPTIPPPPSPHGGEASAPAATLGSEVTRAVACERHFGRVSGPFSSCRGVRLLLSALTAAIEWPGIDLQR